MQRDRLEAGGGGGIGNAGFQVRSIVDVQAGPPPDARSRDPVAPADIAAAAPVVRYGIPLGHAPNAIDAGSGVHARLMTMSRARALEVLPLATAHVGFCTELLGSHASAG